MMHRGTDDTIRLADPPGPPEAYWALWELYRSRPCRRTLPLPPIVRTVAVAGNGNTLWTADIEGNVLNLDPYGRVLSSTRLALTGPPSSPLVGVNGQFVLSTNSARYTLWRVGVEGPILELSHDAGAGAYACLSTDGELLAGITGGQAVIYHVESGAVVGRFGDPGDKVASFALSHDKTRLATRSPDGELHLWDIATERHGARMGSALLPPAHRRPGECPATPLQRRRH
jgi:WD40 repeat protein